MSTTSSAWSEREPARARIFPGNPDEAARAIERAERTLAAGPVTCVNPECGFWMLKRSVADAKKRALVAGRDRFEGRS